MSEEIKIKEKFPSLLFVEEPYSETEGNYEGYKDLNGVGAGTTVAVYELKEICQVKIRSRKELVLDRDPKVAYMFLGESENEEQ